MGSTKPVRRGRNRKGIEKRVFALALSMSGLAGESAYEIAVDNGFVGSQVDWGLSLVGPPGAPGADGADGAPGAPYDGPAPADGADGVPGADGRSAYQVAVDNGFVGTEAEWLASLVGPGGADGEFVAVACDSVPSSTTAFVPPQKYGTGDAVLGGPSAWVEVTIGETVFAVPCYPRA